MKLSNRFKIIWWIALTTLSAVLVWLRWDYLFDRTLGPSDLVVLGLVVFVLLLPFIAEFELFGFKLKQRIDDLRVDVAQKIADLRVEIHSNQSQVVNNNFGGSPPPDWKLPDLQEKLNDLNETTSEETETQTNEDIKGGGQEPRNQIYIPDDMVEYRDVPDINIELFRIRYTIEQEIFRIWSTQPNIVPDPQVGPLPLIRMIHDLQSTYVLGPKFSEVLLGILSICNSAVHNAGVSEAQIAFVKSNANAVLAYLKRIE